MARYAQQWDASAATASGELARKLEIVHEHCRELGRDPREIITSAHIWFDPAEHEIGHVADEAGKLAEQGVDLAIVYLAPPVSPSVLAPLADALAPLR